jgi:hypothetical protein
MKKLTSPQIKALKDLALNAIVCAKFGCYAGGWTIEHIQGTNKSVRYATLTILLRLGMIETKEIPFLPGTTCTSTRAVYRLTPAGEAIVDAENTAAERYTGQRHQPAGALRERHELEIATARLHKAQEALRSVVPPASREAGVVNPAYTPEQQEAYRKAEAELEVAYHAYKRQIMLTPGVKDAQCAN